jgi:hypothetical protein
VRIAILYPHNPWPPRTGSHSRVLAIARSLRKAGHAVLFVSSTYGSDQPWTIDAREALVNHGLASEIALYDRPLLERVRRRTWARWLHSAERPCPCSATQRHWVANRFAAFGPDVVIVNYAMLESWLPAVGRRGYKTVIEMHDFVSVNMTLREVAREWLQTDAKRPQSQRDEAWFDSAINARNEFSPATWELECYRRFDTTVAISPVDAATLHSLAKDCEVTVVQHCPSIGSPRSDRSGLPVIIGSDNPFNKQGAILFRDAVVPRIRATCPSFRFNVVGALADTFRSCPEAIPLGYVADLEREVLPTARFLIAPTFLGTGQQTKVIDCMAAGIPPVLFRDAAARLDLKHRETALTAESVRTFAECCKTLLTDATTLAALSDKSIEHVRHLQGVDYSATVLAAS